ncbi:hypothetical protein [Methylobacterium sp. WL19]|uniref:hypothetical protein n=1 Tax=Methylobacterium sp. WL19 TaxID=2603896 RepID=UPI0011C70C49|nr:hypothetical protein [Methylobacterium sp. WL19]TXN21796.1 hypothetical protein FV220_22675 [Methylobacterium sp. WL19]
MTILITATLGSFRLQPWEPASPPPPPPVNKPDEFWWIEWDEGMPLQPACVSFEGDVPDKVQQLGDDSWGGTPISESNVRLVAPVIPHVPGQVVIAREEFEALYEALRFRDTEAPSFSWLDALKTRVDAQVAAA